MLISHANYKLNHFGSDPNKTIKSTNFFLFNFIPYEYQTEASLFHVRGDIKLGSFAMSMNC